MAGATPSQALPLTTAGWYTPPVTFMPPNNRGDGISHIPPFPSEEREPSQGNARWQKLAAQWQGRGCSSSLFWEHPLSACFISEDSTPGTGWTLIACVCTESKQRWQMWWQKLTSPWLNLWDRDSTSSSLLVQFVLPNLGQFLLVCFYIHEVIDVSQWTNLWGSYILPITDPSWFFTYTQEAVFVEGSSLW